MNMAPEPDSLSTIEEPRVVLSVDKGLMIVELLMRDGQMMAARDIAHELGLNRSTVHRLLNTLMKRGWLEKATDSTYGLSLKFLVLAQLTSRSRDLVQEIRPELERLSNLTGETVHLGMMDGNHVLHVDKVDSPERYGISSRIGSRAVPHLTSLGKAMLAAESTLFTEAYLRRNSRATSPYRIEDTEKARSEIETTRDRGYSIDNEEDSAGVRCLGVAILGPENRPLFAISVTGPAPRFTIEKLHGIVSEVVATARLLSVRFGWKPEGRES